MSFQKIDSKPIDPINPFGAVQPIKLSAKQKRSLGLVSGDTLFIPISRDGEVREPILCTAQDDFALGHNHTDIFCALLTGHPLEVFYAARNILENRRRARRILKLHSWLCSHSASPNDPAGWQLCREIVSLLEENDR